MIFLLLVQKAQWVVVSARCETRFLKNINAVLLPVSILGQFSTGRNIPLNLIKNALLIFNEDLIEGIMRYAALKG